MNKRTGTILGVILGIIAFVGVVALLCYIFRDKLRALIGGCDCCDCDDCDCCDDEVYEIECPACNDVIYLDEDMLCEEGMVCPNCGTDLEFDFEGCDCDCCDCGTEETEE